MDILLFGCFFAIFLVLLIIFDEDIYDLAKTIGSIMIIKVIYNKKTGVKGSCGG